VQNIVLRNVTAALTFSAPVWPVSRPVQERYFSLLLQLSEYNNFFPAKGLFNFIEQAKYGILIASLIAGVLGTLLFKRIARSKADEKGL
jgi:hypothetical protein